MAIQTPTIRLKTGPMGYQDTVYQGKDGEWRYSSGIEIDSESHLHTLIVFAEAVTLLRQVHEIPFEIDLVLIGAFLNRVIGGGLSREERAIHLLKEVRQCIMMPSGVGEAISAFLEEIGEDKG